MKEHKDALPLVLKFQVAVHLRLKKYEYNENGETTVSYLDPHFVSDSKEYDQHSVSDDLAIASRQITMRFDSFVQQGSGWMLDEILLIRLKIYRIRPLQGGSRVETKMLPREVLNKKACLNIEDAGNRCFLYACIAQMHPVKHNAQRRSHYDPYIGELNTSGLTFPVKLKQMHLFEHNNPSVSVNVLGWEAHNHKGYVVPLYRTRNRGVKDTKRKITLLLYKEHFFLIRHLSSLMCGLNKARKSRSYFCHYCLCSYSTSLKLDEHETLCRKELQRLNAPHPPKLIRFEKYRHMFKLPFVIYYDIEAKLVKNDETGNVEHLPISICSFTNCSNPQYSAYPVIFTGSDCTESFLGHLEKERKRITNILYAVKSVMTFDEQDLEKLKTTSKCEICANPFQTKASKYRDHDHLNPSSVSNIRFITCNRCNLTYGRQNFRIPVVSHNGSQYDFHHVVQALRNTSNVSILAKNTEKYLSITLGKQLVFIDSLNFLPGTLDGLSQSLADKDRSRYLQYITSDHRKQNLLKQKGVFPYDYINADDKLEEASLPSQDAFFNSLTNTPLSDADYARAQEIWRVFDCQKA